jgi:uncharacterized membrane protein YbhN (UPF0104 family)
MDFQMIKKIIYQYNLINKLKILIILASVIYTLFYLFSQDELVNKVIIHLIETNITILIYALIAHISVQLLAAMRLKLLIKLKEGVIIGLDKLYAITIMSNFMSQLLPSASIIAEGMRVALLKNKLGSYKKIIKIGIFDKIYGILGLIILSILITILIYIDKNSYKNLLWPLIILPFYLYNKCSAKSNHDNLIIVAILLCSYLAALLNCIVIIIISISIMGKEIHDLTNFLAAIGLIISNMLPIGFAGFGGHQIISGHIYSIINVELDHGIAISIIYGLFLIISNTFQAGIVFLAKIINGVFNEKIDHR